MCRPSWPLGSGCSTCLGGPQPEDRWRRRSDVGVKPDRSRIVRTAGASGSPLTSESTRTQLQSGSFHLRQRPRPHSPPEWGDACLLPCAASAGPTTSWVSAERMGRGKAERRLPACPDGARFRSGPVDMGGAARDQRPPASFPSGGPSHVPANPPFPFPRARRGHRVGWPRLGHACAAGTAFWVAGGRSGPSVPPSLATSTRRPASDSARRVTPTVADPGPLGCLIATLRVGACTRVHLACGGKGRLRSISPARAGLGRGGSRRSAFVGGLLAMRPPPTIVVPVPRALVSEIPS